MITTGIICALKLIFFSKAKEIMPNAVARTNGPNKKTDPDKNADCQVFSKILLSRNQAVRSCIVDRTIQMIARKPGRLKSLLNHSANAVNRHSPDENKIKEILISKKNIMETR